jgi:tetraacyldisaccharide 4'-kinase
MAKFLLWLISGVYGLMIRFLSGFYRARAYRLPCKVISVGNITLGGTGKTPLVEYIARQLCERGHKLAILTRGYQGKVKSKKTKVKNREETADEAQMLQENLAGVPIIVDADRIRGAKRALEDYAVDTVILDDGFQQWRLQKDLEIVAIDATNPFGNRQILPRGILREPLTALRRADILLLTKTDLAADLCGLIAELKGINASALIVESRHAPAGLYVLGDRDKGVALQDLKDKTVALVSGIGGPDSFRQGITRLGINVAMHFKFCDHHHYSSAELDGIFARCRKEHIATLITTEKDAARLSGLSVKESGVQFLVFAIRIELGKDEEGFISRLLSVYNP